MVFTSKCIKALKSVFLFKENCRKALEIADSIRDLKIGLKNVANCMRGVEKGKAKKSIKKCSVFEGRFSFLLCFATLLNRLVRADGRTDGRTTTTDPN